MPLYLNKKLSEEIHFMVWHLSETVEELITLIRPDQIDFETLASISHEAKKKEYLAGKNAVMQMCLLEKIQFEGIEKDEHGKPFLNNHTYEMSLTHTIDYIGVVFSKSKPIGIDIEKPREQIFKVLNRLCVESELNWVSGDLEKATILWSAKEALYKLYGKRKVDFKEHLLVGPGKKGIIGKINIPDHQSEYQIYVQNIEEYLLVIAY